MASDAASAAASDLAANDASIPTFTIVNPSAVGMIGGTGTIGSGRTSGFKSEKKGGTSIGSGRTAKWVEEILPNGKIQHLYLVDPSIPPLVTEPNLPERTKRDHRSKHVTKHTKKPSQPDGPPPPKKAKASQATAKPVYRQRVWSRRDETEEQRQERILRESGSRVQRLQDDRQKDQVSAATARQALCNSRGIKEDNLWPPKAPTEGGPTARLDGYFEELRKLGEDKTTFSPHTVCASFLTLTP